MCERTCPACRSTDHFESYGICGATIMCSDCGTILAAHADEQAAPIDLNEQEVEAWVAARTWVLPGAEAKNPADDELWTPKNVAVDGSSPSHPGEETP